MKVSNNQKPLKDDKAVSRETLNKWQRQETSARREKESEVAEAQKVKSNK